QRAATMFVDKEYDQISPAVSLANSSVQVFVRHIAEFGKLKSWTIQKYLLNFILANMMLSLDLLCKLAQQYNLLDSHAALISSRHANNRHPEKKTHSFQPPAFRTEYPSENSVER